MEKRLRRLDESAYPITSFQDEGAFMGAGTLPEGCLTFDVRGVPIDILNVPAPGAASTIFVFHPAITDAVNTLPFFSGQTVTRGAPANRVWIQDPTLYLDERLNLSWFAGNHKMDVQRVLTNVIRKLLEVHGSKHAIFFGASGGGFAAMYYSRQFPDSLAVAINPQTNIRLYGEESVKQYLEYGLGAEPGSEPVKLMDYPITSDLPREYRKGFPNTVAYVQNAGDTSHVGRHLKGFVREVQGNPRLMLHIGDWGPGHVAPDKEFLQSLIVASVYCFGDWTKLTALGFRPSPSIEHIDERVRQLKEGPSPELSLRAGTSGRLFPWRVRLPSLVERAMARLRGRPSN